MVKSLILCQYFFNLSDAKGLPPSATPNPGVHIPGRFPGLGTRTRVFFIFLSLSLDIFCKLFYYIFMVKSLYFVSLFFFNLLDVKGLPTPATPNPGVHIPRSFASPGTRNLSTFFFFFG